MVTEARTVDRLQMSRIHVSLELRPKTSETVSSVCTNEGRLFLMVGHSMRTDEQQCLSIKTMLTVGLM